MCPFSFCSTSTAFAQKMIIQWILVGAFAYVLLILLYVYCFFTKNKHLQFRKIEIINIIHENHGKWCAVTFNVAQLFIFHWFLNVFWTPLNTRSESPPKVLNCCRSRNAIQTNENNRKPSTVDPQNGELINIPLVLDCFWSLLAAWFPSLPKLPKWRIYMDHKMH